MAELGEGSIFAGYRIERRLGAGGMGTVYLARNPDLPRSEALKVLSAELSRDPAFRARFVREADVAASLDHPNIVSVHQRGEFDGQLWIAMQFVDGTDADAALDAGPMEPARAVRIIAEVGKALDYAHRRGVVHRDIKPANFLLSEAAGGEERVMLADFGIARALGEAGLTATGAVVATLSYAAPEVLAGQPFDGRADLYSLGCSLYGLLTGKTPFHTADGAGAVMAAHLQQPPPRVTHAVPTMSPQMDWVIATAMAKDPARRFVTAGDLAAAAAQALRDDAPQPVPTAPGHVAAQPNWWQQHPDSMTTVAGPTAPVLPPHHPAYVPTKPRRSRRIAVAAAVAALVAAATVTTVVLTSGSDSSAASSPSGAVQSSPTTTSQPALVSNSTLPKLLLPTDKVAEIMGVPALVVDKSIDAIVDDSSGALEDKDKDCIGPLFPVQRVVYADSGWSAAQEQFIVPPEGGGIIVMQGVISFPTVDAAQKIVREQRWQWSKCQHRAVTMSANGQPIGQWTFGNMEIAADTTIAMLVDRGQGFACQRALSIRKNVVIDVNACRIDVTNQGVDIVNGIAKNIPQ